MFIHSPLERGGPVINWVEYLCYIFGRVDIVTNVKCTWGTLFSKKYIKF